VRKHVRKFLARIMGRFVSIEFIAMLGKYHPEIMRIDILSTREMEDMADEFHRHEQRGMLPSEDEMTIFKKFVEQFREPAKRPSPDDLH